MTSSVLLFIDPHEPQQTETGEDTKVFIMGSQ